jgi:polypeptide N-acetylgalactosaminyltransferase
LEPLLDRVANNPTTVAAPVNDIINIDNLAYNYALNNFIGGFTWSLHFTWHPIPEREKVRRTDQSEPFSTPAIAGGIYTMHKHFFQALGMYDPGKNLQNF